jgi:AhpD family alkylhydroperoxidase
MICSACELLTIDRLYAKAGEPINTRDRTRWNSCRYLELHPSYQSLQKAAENGCTNCQAFHEKLLTLHGGAQALAKRLAILAGSQDFPVPVIAYLSFGTKIATKKKSIIAHICLQVGTQNLGPSEFSLILTFKIIGPRGYCPCLNNYSLYKF